MRPFMKQIVANVWQTPDGTILWSKHRHDYQTHLDRLTGEKYIVDGGTDYLRTSENIHVMKNLCVYNTDPHEKIRNWCLRGTLLKDGTIKFVLLKDISNNHLKNIIEYNNIRGLNNTYWHQIYLDELEFRENNNIYIDETDYSSYKIKKCGKK